MAMDSRYSLWLPGFSFQEPKSLGEWHRPRICKNQEGRKSGKEWEQTSMGHSVLCRVLSMAPGTSLYSLSSQICLFLISHNYNQLQTATMTTIHFSSSPTDANAINSWYHSFRADQVFWNAYILIKHLVKHCKSTLFFKHTWNLANGPSWFVFLLNHLIKNICMILGAQRCFSF